jgi:hypothetical protein
MRKSSYFIAVKLLAGPAMVFISEAAPNLPPGIRFALSNVEIEAGPKSGKHVSSREGAILSTSSPTCRFP